MRVSPTYTSPLNPKGAQDIARRPGNDKLIFWTSVASIGFMGVMAVTTTANMISNMVRRGQNGQLGEPERQHGQRRGRG